MSVLPHAADLCQRYTSHVVGMQATKKTKVWPTCGRTADKFSVFSTVTYSMLIANCCSDIDPGEDFCLII